MRVEVFGCNIQMTLAPDKVTAFAQDRATRLARQQHSELGRQVGLSNSGRQDVKHAAGLGWGGMGGWGLSIGA